MIRGAVILAFVGGVAVLSARVSVEQSAREFDVASVKPSPPEPPTGMPISSVRPTPGRWLALRATVVQLIGVAYPEFRFDGHVIGEPAWARTEQFDIEARMDPAIPLADVGPLVARLLADRFALRTRTEQRILDVYVLRMERDDGKLGTRLKRSDPACVEARAARQLPLECRGSPAAAVGGLNLPTSRMSEFLTLLAIKGIDRPVIDRTGLAGHFDLQLTYQCGPFNGPFGISGRPCGSDGVSFFTALREQAGLKLEPAREAVNVLVVDSVERPTPD